MIEDRVKLLQETIIECSEELRLSILEFAPYLDAKMKNEPSEIESIKTDWRFLFEQHELHSDSAFNNMIFRNLGHKEKEKWFVSEFENLMAWGDLHWFDLLILLEDATSDGLQGIGGTNLELAYLCCKICGEKAVGNWLELVNFWSETKIKQNWIRFIKSNRNKMQNKEHLSRILERDFSFIDKQGEYFRHRTYVQARNSKDRPRSISEIWSDFFEGTTPSSFSVLFNPKNHEKRVQIFLGRGSSRRLCFCPESILEEPIFNASWDVLIKQIGTSSPFVLSFIESYFSKRSSDQSNWFRSV